ncbi:hypothetical protein ACMD2_22892 [Ananas comosus]|uniref:Uncharacterized protein n=1 Tax=Ananas comosus TaxID=4615 RepID=A0A199VNY0_ANACO|nr:hypothetical protein ACMD2_22892 [Ananas comosus]
MEEAKEGSKRRRGRDRSGGRRGRDRSGGRRGAIEAAGVGEGPKGWGVGEGSKRRAEVVRPDSSRELIGEASKIKNEKKYSSQVKSYLILVSLDSYLKGLTQSRESQAKSYPALRPTHISRGCEGEAEVLKFLHCAEFQHRLLAIGIGKENLVKLRIGGCKGEVGVQNFSISTLLLELKESVLELRIEVGEALIALEANSALVALSRVIPLRIHFETWILVVDTTTGFSASVVAEDRGKSPAA